MAWAPTGNNLEQTVPNCSQMCSLGCDWTASAGGEGLLSLTLNSPDCAQHKTPSVSMRGRERETYKEEGATREDSCFMMSGDGGVILKQGTQRRIFNI